MPNYVHHWLTITGPATERQRFMAECFSVADDGMRFDFDKLIPQPERIKNDHRVIFTGEAPDWYNWRCENWGTKWNACYTRFEREGEAIFLKFDTAWSLPTPILNEVAKRFPKLRIEGDFIEEMHHFGGDILCENGTVKWKDRSEEIRSEFNEAMKAAGAFSSSHNQDDDGPNVA